MTKMSKNTSTEACDYARRAF